VGHSQSLVHAPSRNDPLIDAPAPTGPSSTRIPRSLQLRFRQPPEDPGRIVARSYRSFVRRAGVNQSVRPRKPWAPRIRRWSPIDPVPSTSSRTFVEMPCGGSEAPRRRTNGIVHPPVPEHEPFSPEIRVVLNLGPCTAESEYRRRVGTTWRYAPALPRDVVLVFAA